MTSRPQFARGFTLLELIVVVGIFAVLSLLAYGGLRNVLDARTAVEQSLQRTVALQRTYLRLRDDLQQLQQRPIRDNFGDTEAALQTQAAGVAFTRGGWRNPLGHPRSTLERVAYQLNEDRQLLRASWRTLDRAQESEASEIALLEKVDHMEWRYLDSQNVWSTSWPNPLATTAPGKDPELPRAVEVTLDLADVGTVRLLFATGRP